MTETVEELKKKIDSLIERQHDFYLSCAGWYKDEKGRWKNTDKQIFAQRENPADERTKAINIAKANALMALAWEIRDLK